MSFTATITSKRQLTLPAKLFELLGLQIGEKVVLSEKNGEVTIKPAVQMVEELAGSVKTPKAFQKLSEDQIIEKSKQEFLASKKSL